MKSAKWYYLVLFLVILTITSCTPTCDVTLAVPSNTSPLNMTMVGDLRPTLTWDYPEENCTPDEFIINFFTNSTNGTISPAPAFGGPTGSSETTFTPASDLTTGVAYLWSVSAKNSTDTGPGSNQWQFFVGPVCQTADLIAPDLVEPVGGTTISTTDPNYIWDYSDPGCTPEGYHLQVSEMADFSSLEVDVRSTDHPFKAWQTGDLLSDCTDYYWRVAAVHDTDDGPWSTVGEFSVDAVGACLCTLPELVQPVLVWPGPYEIVPDLLPILEWSWPGDCEVGGYGIHLSTDFDFADTSLNGGTGNPSTTWMPGPTLEPAMQYWWEVFAGVGTNFGPPSSKRSFFTGPECANLGEVDAPELLYPADGETIDTLIPWLHWRAGDPGCIPDGYLVDLQTTSSFTGTNLLGEYGIPATNLMPEPELDDCETYYWRVAGVQGGSPGPYSETRWFRTNESGSCLFPYYPGWVLENVNCRTCADRICPIRYIFEQGMMAEVLGRSLDGAYVKLANPNGGECYSPKFAIEVDIEKVEVVRLPPTPTPVPPTPTPVCTENLNQRECIAAGGTWVDSKVRTPYCLCP
ncbi:MAG: hypothetical protein PVG02_01565 [Anaerolineales bacterium]